RRLVVAGQQHDVDALAAQGGHGLGGAGLDRVRDRDETGGPAIDRDEGDGASLRAQLRLARGQGGDGDALLAHQASRAGEQRPAFDTGADAAARYRLEVLDVRQLEAALLRRADDGGAQRVLGAAFGGGGETQEVVLR